MGIKTYAPRNSISLVSIFFEMKKIYLFVILQQTWYGQGVAVRRDGFLFKLMIEQSHKRNKVQHCVNQECDCLHSYHHLIAFML